MGCLKNKVREALNCLQLGWLELDCGIEGDRHAGRGGRCNSSQGEIE